MSDCLDLWVLWGSCSPSVTMIILVETKVSVRIYN